MFIYQIYSLYSKDNLTSIVFFHIKTYNLYISLYDKIYQMMLMGKDVVFMLKIIIITTILAFMYISYASLMKAAGKKTPVMPEIKHNKDNDRDT